MKELIKQLLREQEEKESNFEEFAQKRFDGAQKKKVEMQFLHIIILKLNYLITKKHLKVILILKNLKLILKNTWINYVNYLKMLIWNK